MDEYREAVKEFYRVYRPLQKKHNLRMHSRFSIYDDGFIEIWEYTGEQRGKCVCKVKEEKDVETLEQWEQTAGYDARELKERAARLWVNGGETETEYG